MTQRNLLPRLLPAAAVTVVAALLLGTAVGVAHAGLGKESATGPVVLGTPRLGDRGRYDATLEGAWLEGDVPRGEPFPFLEFEWRDGPELRDGEGYVVATDMVATTGWHYDPLAHEDTDGDGAPDAAAWRRHSDAELYRKGTSFAVGVRGQETEAQGDHFDGPIPGFPEVLAQSYAYHSNATWTLYAEDGEPDDCLLVHRLQGEILGREATVPFAPRCAIHGLFELGSLDLSFSGDDVVSGVPSARYEAVGLGDITVRAWFATGLPYPMQLEVALPATEGQADEGREIPPAGARLVRLTLASFEPGQVERTRGPAPRDAVPELTMSPRKPWGLDDAGADLSFPPSTAYRKAHDDPVYAGLRDFLKAHPKAVASFGFLAPTQSDDAFVQQSWFLGFGDGSSGHVVHVERRTPSSASALPQALQEMASVYRVEGFDYDLGPANVDSAPEEYPTILSLQERWALYTSNQEGKVANSVLWVLVCADDGCAKQEILVGAGSIELAGKTQLDPAGPALRHGFAYAGSQLFVRPDHGAASLLFEYDVGFDSAAGIVSAGHGREPAASVRTASGPVAFVFPTPLEAAGAGALALVVGAMYWLWPVLKSGAVLGFSRLRPARLLDHPLRSRITDAVEAEPGIHFQELSRRTGIPNGNLVHHVRKLVAAQLLVAHRSGRYTCYFPPTSKGPERGAAALTKSSGARAVLAAVQSTPGLTMQEVAARCGLQPSTVTYHVHRLAEAGLVSVSRDGRSQRVQARA